MTAIHIIEHNTGCLLFLQVLSHLILLWSITWLWVYRKKWLFLYRVRGSIFQCKMWKLQWRHVKTKEGVSVVLQIYMLMWVSSMHYSAYVHVHNTCECMCPVLQVLECAVVQVGWIVYIQWCALSLELLNFLRVLSPWSFSDCSDGIELHYYIVYIHTYPCTYMCMFFLMNWVWVSIFQEIVCSLNNVRALPRDTNLRLQVCDMGILLHLTNMHIIISIACCHV